MNDDEIPSYRINRSTYDSTLSNLMKQEQEYNIIYNTIENVILSFPGLRVERHFKNEEGMMGIVIIGNIYHIQTELTDAINTRLIPYDKKIVMTNLTETYTDYDIVDI